MGRPHRLTFWLWVTRWVTFLLVLAMAAGLLVTKRSQFFEEDRLVDEDNRRIDQMNTARSGAAQIEHRKPHAKFAFVTERLDDPSFWMFLAALFSLGKVVQAWLCLRAALQLLRPPPQQAPASTEWLFRLCWIALVVMILSYLSFTWYTGEAAFHPKVSDTVRWIEEGLASTEWFGAVHWYQLADAGLTIVFILLGCGGAAWGVRIATRAQAAIVSGKNSEAPDRNLPPVADGLSYLASAGLGPSLVFCVWLGVWRLLRAYVPKFPWLGSTDEFKAGRVLPIVLTVALLCTPYVILYCAAWRRSWPTFSFHHRKLRLLLLGWLGMAVTARLRGEGPPIDPSAGGYTIKYRLPGNGGGGEDQVVEATAAATSTTSWQAVGPAGAGNTQARITWRAWQTAEIKSFPAPKCRLHSLWTEFC